MSRPTSVWAPFAYARLHVSGPASSCSCSGKAPLIWARSPHVCPRLSPEFLPPSYSFSLFLSLSLVSTRRLLSSRSSLAPGKPPRRQSKAATRNTCHSNSTSGSDLTRARCQAWAPAFYMANQWAGAPLRAPSRPRPRGQNGPATGVVIELVRPVMVSAPVGRLNGRPNLP